MYLLHSSILNNNIILPLIHALHLSQQVGAFVGMGLFWGLTLVLATLMYKYFEVPVMALRNKLTATEPTKVLV
jgi:peptidoglycan/LPS O-acetylase OafA/YrhL